MTERFKESCKQCPSWYKCNLDSICYIAAATRQKCQNCTDYDICPWRTTYGRVRCHESKKTPDLSKMSEDLLLYLASGHGHSRGECPFEKRDDAELQKQYEVNVGLFKAGLIHQDFVLTPQQMKDNKIAEYGKPMDIIK